MIKTETVGAFDVAKVNPVITSEDAVKNYQFIEHEGKTYLVANTLSGDAAHREDVVIAAGEYLNGYMVEAWEGQKLVIDEKHIAYGESEDYASIVAGTTLLVIDNDGNLAIAAAAPESGVYFKVTDKTTLTGKAVKALVVVVDETASE